MKKYAVLTLLLSLFTTTYCQNDEPSTLNSRYKVVGEKMQGVWDINNDIMIVDSIYDHVEIHDVGIIVCQYTSFVSYGVVKKLPAPVFESYDINGEKIARNVDYLLQADSMPYTLSLDFARSKGIREVEPMVELMKGMHYEKKKMRREAYKHYMNVYNQYPEFTLAKELADNIMNDMNNERAKIKREIEQEEEMRKIRDAQYTNPYLAFAESMSSLANTLNSIDQNDKAKRNNQPATTSKAKPTSGKNKKGSQQKETKRATSHERERVCNFCGGTGRCYYMFDLYASNKHCHGTGKCTECHGEGICRSRHTNDYMVCPLCNGKKTCCFCSGSGRCSRCNGSGKIKTVN
ncbi:MAG: hypothetical protein J6Y98_06160 [Bacteroidales bacterium]|nr:hypothetical protein [Bacteroidales bacterium]